MFIFFFIIFILNFFLVKFYKQISKIYNLFDYPDYKRKIHKKPIPLLGGLFLMLNLSLILIYKFFFDNYINFFFFENLITYINFFIVTFFFFLIGFYDDKYKINVNLKFILSAILIILTLILDESLLIKSINFTFLKNSVDLGFFSYFFTILSFLLFINAFNMLDGINGQATCYVLYIFVLLVIKSVLVQFICVISIGLLYFLILNFYNKSFLGDSGTLPLGFIISYIFIKIYNSSHVFLADEIFLIMSIPGYELLRLAISRIYKNKNPFLPDRNHIHHLLLNRYKFFSTFLFVQFILATPYLTYALYGSFIFSFIFSLVFYLFFIGIFTKKKKSYFIK